MDSIPLLSVIIPTYNCEDILDETVGSVLSQLPDDCELIIVDDGSSDGTARRLRALVGTHRNLRVCCAEHSGASGARNRGLDLARGEYVAFMDCDDCLREGFLGESLPLTESGADLYIFGLERVPLTGDPVLCTLEDGIYGTAGAFADAYIRTREFLVYSNCNKFYRREIIERVRLRFEEGNAFGEDRLFNYAFLLACASDESSRPCVVTSSIIMLRYIRRSGESMSSRYVPGFFECVMRLHEEKMKCFIGLSENTTEEERLDFEAFDLSCEVETAINRFERNPREKDEGLPLINRLIFGEPCDAEGPVDVLVVLGSVWCRHRVERALLAGRGDPDVEYVVSGGSPYIDGTCTEAEYMAEYLRKHGVADRRIHLENRARYTLQNLLFSNDIVQDLKNEAQASGVRHAPLRIGIVTGGFHVKRARLLVEETGIFAGDAVSYFPAYSSKTQKDSWFEYPGARELLLSEVRKTLVVEKTSKRYRGE